MGNVRDTTEYRVHNLGLCPKRVEAVDCLLVATRRTNRVRWDLQVPGFAGGMAEDLCLQAREQGRGVWVVNVYTEHWCRAHDLETDAPYQAARRYVLAKWPHVRPILTTAAIWA